MGCRGNARPPGGGGNSQVAADDAAHGTRRLDEATTDAGGREPSCRRRSRPPCSRSTPQQPGCGEAHGAGGSSSHPLGALAGDQKKEAAAATWGQEEASL